MTSTCLVRSSSGVVDPLDEPKSARGLLLLAAVAALILWQLPYGPQALYPLTLLATYAHEMGHGLTALFLGGSFDRMSMFADGSGLAEWHGELGRIGVALVAAGGLIGPSVAGVLLLLASRDARRGRILLGLFGALLLASMLLFVRNVFGFVFIGAMGAGALLGARLLSRTAAAFVVQLIAVVLCLAVFRDLDYMFSAGATV